jgi:hypothetical protein
MEPEPIEELAKYAHKAWSVWMEYLFSLCISSGDSLIIPASLVRRWKRQASTPYNDLPESEKESDRIEALKIMEIIYESKNDS